jgi:hypothetical protein
MAAAPDQIRGRGKSGLQEATVPGNARRGNPRESATENRLPRLRGKGETVG